MLRVGPSLRPCVCGLQLGFITRLLPHPLISNKHTRYAHYSRHKEELQITHRIKMTPSARMAVWLFLAESASQGKGYMSEMEINCLQGVLSALFKGDKVFISYEMVDTVDRSCPGGRNMTFPDLQCSLVGSWKFKFSWDYIWVLDGFWTCVCRAAWMNCGKNAITIMKSSKTRLKKEAACLVSSILAPSGRTALV